MAHDDAGASPAGEGRRSAFPGTGDSGPISRADPSVPDASAAGRYGSDDDRRAAAAAAAAPGARPGSSGPATSAPGRLVAVVGAVVAGITAAVFGTLLHAHVLFVAGTALPVGAVAALALAGSLFLLSGLWARSVAMTAVAGVVAYGVVALLSTSSKTLILTGSSEVAPGTAAAGNLWLFGVLAMTLVAVTLGAVVLRPQRRR
ncbi:hypothetical protein ACX80U_00565 [Arthrobacter sp. TmT3-37]